MNFQIVLVEFINDKFLFKNFGMNLVGLKGTL